MKNQIRWCAHARGVSFHSRSYSWVSRVCPINLEASLQSTLPRPPLPQQPEPCCDPITLTLPQLRRLRPHPDACLW